VRNYLSAINIDRMVVDSESSVVTSIKGFMAEINPEWQMRRLPFSSEHAGLLLWHFSQDHHAYRKHA
jgi:hypothetical protein